MPYDRKKYLVFGVCVNNETGEEFSRCGVHEAYYEAKRVFDQMVSTYRTEDPYIFEYKFACLMLYGDSYEIKPGAVPAPPLVWIDPFYTVKMNTAEFVMPKSKIEI